MSSRRANVGFSPRKRPATNPGAKPLSTAISARARRQVARPGAAGDHQGPADRGAMRRLDGRFTPAGGLGVVTQREARQRQHKVGVSVRASEASIAIMRSTTDHALSSALSGRSPQR